jgi:hypothetical protein
MNNDNAKVVAVLRSLAVFGTCAVIAVILGVLMTNPITFESLGFVAAVCAILFIPLLLRWHHPLMILSWNVPVTLFFLKGDPNLFLVMIVLSLTISLTEGALGRQKFIYVPQITWPLLFLILVILVTAKLTGGFGLKAFGSEVYGGKKYIFLIVAILGFFAITSRTIPPEKARLYVTLYFAGGLLCFLEDFSQLAHGPLRYIYLLVPPSYYYDPNGFELGTTRLAGICAAAIALINILIARYGLRGIFLSGKLWRPTVFFISFVLIFFGGFRSGIIVTSATILLLFFLEGLHRTKLMPYVIMFAVTCTVLVIPLGSKLPFTFQRSLAFLPPSVINLTPEARYDAEDSWNWRIKMWTALMPQIPKHLLLGKGYAITPEDFESMGADASFQNAADASQQGLALAGDYHNGPLSVILPFGIWGAFVFSWFLAGSLWVVYRNYRYSDPGLKTLNAFLFAFFVITSVEFFGGTLATNMNGFTGILGLSVCINRGVCRAPLRKGHDVPFRIRLRNPRQHLQPGGQNAANAAVGKPLA